MHPHHAHSFFSLNLVVIVVESTKENYNQTWWLTSIIPVTQKVEMGGSQFEASLGKS
jgi:hypothetical protein